MYYPRNSEILGESYLLASAIHLSVSSLAGTYSPEIIQPTVDSANLDSVILSYCYAQL